MSGKTYKSRGRSSNESQALIELKKKQRPSFCVPTKEVRLDSFEHWPHWTNNRNRCKLPSCNKLCFIICTKCQAALSFNNERNCFAKFHS